MELYETPLGSSAYLCLNNIFMDFFVIKLFQNVMKHACPPVFGHFKAKNR